MKLKKTILRNLLVQNLLGIITAIYIFVVRITSQLYFNNESVPNKFWKNNEPFILAFWHSQLLMISFCWKSKNKINILASGHRDGRFGAIVGKYFNLNNIPTSLNNQALSLRPIFKILKNKNYIGITPDGPRGPKETVSSGIIKIARTSQVPILALGFASSSNKTLNSWDSFLITLPFAKCSYVWSEPITIPKNLDDKDIPKDQLIIEKKINNCIAIARKELSV